MGIAERLAWTAVAAAVLGAILLVPPIVGFADNGDFSKVIGRFDMGSPPDDEARYITPRWVFDARWRWMSDFRTSELLFVTPAVETVRRLLGLPAFDLRIIGVVHGVVFLAAWWLLLPLAAPLGRRRFVPLVACVLVFGDVMYVSYYNSFHMDAAALLFLLLAAVLFLRAISRPSRTNAAAFLLAALLLVLSKTQHALLAVPIAGVLLWQGARLWPCGTRAVSTLAAAVVLAAAGYQFATSPHGYQRPALFSTIFWGILPHSPDVAGDLQRLGLDDTYRKYIGLHAYLPGSPTDDPGFQPEFDRRTSYGKLARLYLVCPERAWGRLRDGLDNGGLQRVFELGSFARDSGLPERSNSHRFSLWSDAKRRMFGRHGLRYLAWGATLVAGLCWLARRRPELLAGALTLAAMAAIELLLASLADSLELCRHLFLFNALLDVMLLALIWAAAAPLQRSAFTACTNPRM